MRIIRVLAAEDGDDNPDSGDNEPDGDNPGGGTGTGNNKPGSGTGTGTGGGTNTGAGGGNGTNSGKKPSGGQQTGTSRPPETSEAHDACLRIRDSGRICRTDGAAEEKSGSPQRQRKIKKENKKGSSVQM